MSAIPMVEIWRGPILESAHAGHGVVCDAHGAVLERWGADETVILPRSSAKMIQALPLVESGAADAAGLGPAHLALACASHSAAQAHTDRVIRWLTDQGFDDDDLRCGPAEPHDIAARNALIRADAPACQVHNECSGKHAGFLTLSRRLGGGPDYVDPAHPVQRAVREAFEDVTGAVSPGFGIDGCSAPSFATTLRGLARAMARFAAADPEGGARDRAMARLVRAMTTHPDLVAGEGLSCTRLMRAMGGRVAVKTGADGVFVAILPDRKLGVAVKIVDGARRASDCVITSILVRLGVLDAADPVAMAYRDAPILNKRGIRVGTIRPTDALR